MRLLPASGRMATPCRRGTGYECACRSSTVMLDSDGECRTAIPLIDSTPCQRTRHELHGQTHDGRSASVSNQATKTSPRQGQGNPMISASHFPPWDLSPSRRDRACPACAERPLHPHHHHHHHGLALPHSKTYPQGGSRCAKRKHERTADVGRLHTCVNLIRNTVGH